MKTKEQIGDFYCGRLIGLTDAIRRDFRQAIEDAIALKDAEIRGLNWELIKAADDEADAVADALAKERAALREWAGSRGWLVDVRFWLDSREKSD